MVRDFGTSDHVTDIVHDARTVHESQTLGEHMSHAQKRNIETHFGQLIEHQRHILRRSQMRGECVLVHLQGLQPLHDDE